MGKRKKKKSEENAVVDSWLENSSDESSTSSDEDSNNERKYKPYYVSDYSRRYPEDSILTDYVVFVESSDDKRPIGTRDMMSLSTQVKRFNKGIKFLQSMNKFKIAGAFLASVAGISAFIGFGTTLSTVKKSDPKYFSKGMHGSAELADAGAILALRALGWGTLYAITGTTCLCYGIWKLSGAKDLKEFRLKIGNILPVLPKNNPPQSRTEFSGLNDLLTYLSEDYGKKPTNEK